MAVRLNLIREKIAHNRDLLLLLLLFVFINIHFCDGVGEKIEITRQMASGNQSCYYNMVYRSY